MEEIRIGDYCKDIYGRIGKIKSYSNGTYFTGKFGANSGEIVIHSPNIIDLIQEGDYVNGEKVLCFKNENCDDDIGTEYSDDFGEYYGYNEEDIKTIVTKEQFKSVEYIVGESNG